MTAPLRRAHLGIWVVLAAVFAVVLAVGLATRRDPVSYRNVNLRWEQLR